ncbi:MAG: hypothetical protein WCC37_15405 [Candidatus Sulfotelmatobacter sp.]
MNTCGTCKYFGAQRESMAEGADSSGTYIPAPYKACGFMEMEWHFGDTPSQKNAVAFVVDGSGFYAALCVSDEFGCNQWTAK